jgi:hypothetical protein
MDRESGRGAELRAERIRWRGRSRSMSTASRSMDERLRKMNYQAHPGQAACLSRRAKRKVAYKLGRSTETQLALAHRGRE